MYDHSVVKLDRSMTLLYLRHKKKDPSNLISSYVPIQRAKNIDKMSISALDMKTNKKTNKQIG